MKHIYKLSIVLLAVFTFVGCNVDDDDALNVLPQKSITASFDNQSDIIGVPDDATSYDLVISFSEPLPSYSTVEYSLDGGDTKTSSTSTGNNTLKIPVAFGANDNFIDVNLSDFIVVNASVRNFTTSISGNTSVRLMRKGYFAVKMTWEGGQDIDIDLDEMTSFWSWSGNTVDSSAGVTNEENVSGVLSDGNYALYITEFPQVIFSPFFTQPVDITFDITTSENSFSFTINPPIMGWNFWLTKSINSEGNASYAFFTEDPS